MNQIEYDIYPKPRPMHVTVPEGTKKFSFAGATGWTDLTTTGPTYPFNANVDILGEAHVHFGDETATYLLDAIAIGPDFKETHMPAYTVGFNHTQLADGYIEPVKKPIPPEREQRLRVLIQSDQDQPSPELAALPTTEIDYQTVEDAEEWRQWLSTYVPFDAPRLYTAKQDEWVHDHMAKRPDKLLKAHTEVPISGTFIHNDIEYARPALAQKNFLWYGIEKANLISDEELHKELYNQKEPLHIRVAMPKGKRSLSTSERYIIVPLAKAISQTTRLRARFGKNKNNKSKEN